MKKHRLERYLSPTQAAAWVVYRDPKFVNLCKKPDVYHGETVWPNRIRHADEQDLALALLEGRVTALGKEKGRSGYAPIPAINWAAMRVAPQYPERHHHPFAQIRVERDELLKVFPSLGEADGKGERELKGRGAGAGRPQTLDYDLVEGLAKNYVGMSQEKVASNVVADYESVKGSISPSSVKRRLRKLRNGRSK